MSVNGFVWLFFVFAVLSALCDLCPILLLSRLDGKHFVPPYPCHPTTGSRPGTRVRVRTAHTHTRARIVSSAISAYRLRQEELPARLSALLSACLRLLWDPTSGPMGGGTEAA